MFLCECDAVVPLWLEILNILRLKTDPNLNLTNYEKMFGICNNSFITYITLCIKYFIYRCKFQDKKPTVPGLKSFIKLQRETEYHIAKSKNKLALHFKKWVIVL